MILRATVYLTLLFLLGPLLIIILFSFHASAALSFPFVGFSLRWYQELFGNPQLLDALWKSFQIAASTAVVTLLLGTGASLAWLRLSRTGRRWLEIVCILPIAMPALFVGVALLIGFAQVRVPLSTATIVVAHVILALPMLMVAVRARLELFDPSLEEAARDLGAGLVTTFARVTLPLIAPTLIASAIMSFALSFDEFVVTSFVAGTQTTLPMFVWSMMRRTVTPTINAVSTLAIVLSVLLLLIAWAIGRFRRAQALSASFSDEE